MLKTEICQILGIEYPIFQGGMAWAATAELAAAVSNAGGFGIIGAGNAPKEFVVKEIRKAKELTDKPFGVNIYFISPFVDQVIEGIIEEKVAAVTTGAGNPGKYIQVFKDAGIKVFPLVSSVALAKRLARTGVDGLIAEGMECGGHIGEITTMALIPQIVDAVDIPVIAAGGLFDGRSMAAAFCLGAQGIQMGTRFLASNECTIHENYKEALIKAGDRATTLTGYKGHYVRVLKNKLTKDYDQLIKSGASEEEVEKLGSGRLRLAVVDGDSDMGSLMAGQVASMIKEKESCQEIIDDLVSGAEKTLKSFCQ